MQVLSARIKQLRAQTHTPPASAGATEYKGPTQRPELLEALGSQMLPVFLLANVLTGMVNLSMDTGEVGGALARVILVVYTAVLCGAALLLEQGGVRMRL